MQRGEIRSEKVSKPKTRHTPMFMVLLHNDDVNAMDHVVSALMTTFHFEVPKAIEIMREAHLKGVALCETLPLEQAEFRKEMLQSLSLTATIEPEG